MKFLRGFGQFWYDFIIGDDWKIAAGVIVALVIIFVAMTSGVLGDSALAIFGGAVIVTLFVVSLLLDVRRHWR